jgi:hypothetical protein
MTLACSPCRTSAAQASGHGDGAVAQLQLAAVDGQLAEAQEALIGQVEGVHGGDRRLHGGAGIDVLHGAAVRAARAGERLDDGAPGLFAAHPAGEDGDAQPGGVLAGRRCGAPPVVDRRGLPPHPVAVGGQRSSTKRSTSAGRPAMTITLP